MGKKQLVALADELRRVPGGVPAEVLDAICRFCQAQNPRFMRERFLNYLNGTAGPNGGPAKKGKVRA